MKKFEKLRGKYIDYLKQNPKSFRGLKESCEFLGIRKSDINQKSQHMKKFITIIAVTIMATTMTQAQTQTQQPKQPTKTHKAPVQGFQNVDGRLVPVRVKRPALRQREMAIPVPAAIKIKQPELNTPKQPQR